MKIDRKISDFCLKYERFEIQRSYFEVTKIQVLQENLNIITNSVLYI